MPTRRLGRLSGATAQRLLDGGDGPSPLPQLLAAASAPATAPELRGEHAARAAFRSSTQSVPLPDDLPRKPAVGLTSSIMIVKAVTAIALTAGTAGGIALATTATPADPPARTTSESAAADDAASSSRLVTSTTPTGAAPADPDGTADATAADEPGRSGSAGTASRTAPEAATGAEEAQAPHPTGLCHASSNIAHHGKAADSPALADPSCTDADARAADADAAATRPAARPAVAPGNPEHRTGKPDDAGQTSKDTDGGDTAEKPGKAGHGAAAHADTEDRGRSAEHRQDG